MRDGRDGLGPFRVRALPGDASRPVLDEPQKKSMIAAAEQLQVALHEAKHTGPRRTVRYIEHRPPSHRCPSPGRCGHARDPQQVDHPQKELLVVREEFGVMPL